MSKGFLCNVNKILKFVLTSDFNFFEIYHILDLKIFWIRSAVCLTDTPLTKRRENAHSWRENRWDWTGPWWTSVSATVLYCYGTDELASENFEIENRKKYWFLLKNTRCDRNTQLPKLFRLTIQSLCCVRCFVCCDGSDQIQCTVQLAGYN